MTAVTTSLAPASPETARDAGRNAPGCQAGCRNKEPSSPPPRSPTKETFIVMYQPPSTARSDYFPYIVRDGAHLPAHPDGDVLNGPGSADEGPGVGTGRPAARVASAGCGTGGHPLRPRTRARTRARSRGQLSTAPCTGRRAPSEPSRPSERSSPASPGVGPARPGSGATAPGLPPHVLHRLRRQKPPARRPKRCSSRRSCPADAGRRTPGTPTNGCRGKATRADARTRSTSSRTGTSSPRRLRGLRGPYDGDACRSARTEAAELSSSASAFRYLLNAADHSITSRSGRNPTPR